MCILCVVQKWSRRVVSMLPWLVIPLIGLWALSQLLPPGLRFEITSPRLACVLVLLGTLFWYEIVLPQLSVYWVRRSARIRERQRIQAMELQKLRKTATRRCRNCLTPYREQNPGGGKFMCSYCGHVSKRPVLDIPGSPGSSGIISNLVKKNGWFCSQDYLAEGGGNWASPVPRYWVNSCKEQCVTEQSYSGAAVFTEGFHRAVIFGNLLSSVFSCVRWFSRKVLRLGSYGEDSSSDADHRGLSRKGENGGNCQESKGEKARRKAEEKRQARMEKEMLEEEERKQREEIARLIEERRKLRDEKLECEKERLKGLAQDIDRDGRKETEKRKQDRKKEKDKGSSKRNSDGEDVERKENKETEKKHEFDKKVESEKRDSSKPTTEGRKMHMEAVPSVKGVTNKNKYLDRIRGSFLASSRGLPGTTFFEKGSHPTTLAKSTKPISGFVDYTQNSGNKREGHDLGHAIGKASSNGDINSAGTAFSQPPQATTQKKSWHQLFSRSSAVSPSPEASDRSYQIGQPDAQISQLSDQKIQSHPLHNQLQFRQSPAFAAYPLMNGSLACNSVSTLFTESRFPIGGQLDHNFTAEEAELFEDPCYVPDPVSLLGPVSESLDDFAGDSGTGFMVDYGSTPPHIMKNASETTEAIKPSPIESLKPKLQIVAEKHIGSAPCAPKSRDQGALRSGESTNVNEQGTWQMWGSPLGQDRGDLVSGAVDWLLPLRQNKNNHEEIMHPPLHNPFVPHTMKDTNVLHSAFNHSQTAHIGNQNGGTFSPFAPILSKNDPWLLGTVFRPLPGDEENHFPSLNFHDNASQSEMAYESPKASASNHSFDHFPASCWSKRDWAVHDVEDVGSNVIGSRTGSLFSANPDVQSGFLVRGQDNISMESCCSVSDRETLSS